MRERLRISCAIHEIPRVLLVLASSSTCTGGYQPVPTPGCSTYIEYDSYYELVHSMKKYFCVNIIFIGWS